MIRRPPRSTLSSSSAASDVYKRQGPVMTCPRVPAYGDDRGPKFRMAGAQHPGAVSALREPGEEEARGIHVVLPARVRNHLHQLEVVLLPLGVLGGLLGDDRDERPEVGIPHEFPRQALGELTAAVGAALPASVQEEDQGPRPGGIVRARHVDYVLELAPLMLDRSEKKAGRHVRPSWWRPHRRGGQRERGRSNNGLHGHRLPLLSRPELSIVGAPCGRIPTSAGSDRTINFPRR